MEEDEALIECVRKKPVLYDISLISYRNCDKKEAAWREIAADLNCDGLYNV